MNRNVPSLVPPMTVATQIYCTDCHNSDGTSTARGPHGSIYPGLLAARCETADFTPESSSSYELCYRCHSRNSIWATRVLPVIGCISKTASRARLVMIPTASVPPKDPS